MKIIVDKSLNPFICMRVNKVVYYMQQQLPLLVTTFLVGILEIQ
jgi:hypothetical protein